MFKLKLKRREGRRKKRRTAADSKTKSIAGRLVAISLAALASIAFAASVVTIFANLDYFKVRAVEMVGGEGLDSVRAEELLKTCRGTSIFSCDINTMAETTARRYPDAKSVIVRRKLPNTVSISITLRKPIALIGADRYYPVDRDGLILPNADASIWQKLPVISGVNLKESDKVGKICESRTLKVAIELITEMEKSRFSSDYLVTTIDVSDPKNVSFFLEDGLEVKVGHESFKARLERLIQALKNPKLILGRIKYIDLRFKDIVIGQK